MSYRVITIITMSTPSSYLVGVNTSLSYKLIYEPARKYPLLYSNSNLIQHLTSGMILVCF